MVFTVLEAPRLVFHGQSATSSGAFKCHRMVSGSFGICTGVYNGCGCHKHSTIVPGLGICLGVGLGTLVALGEGREGISMDERCH